MKTKFVPFILSTTLVGTAIGFSAAVLFNKTSAATVSAYDLGSLPTTIYVGPVGEEEIRNYYSSLDNLECSGTDLLINLKEILKTGQEYYSYDTDNNGKKIWQIYEIIDRDLDKSPYSDLGSLYDESTYTITGYTYGTSASNSGTNPFLHALYVDREADNQIRAWHATDSSSSNHGNNGEWNIDREHIWAKSQGFNDKENAGPGVRGDLMHLWPGDSETNSNPHSDNHFGYVDTSDTSNLTLAKWDYAKNNFSGTPLTSGGDISSSQVVFEPQDSDKGDIARAIFYLVARYNNLSGTDTTIDVNNPNLELVQGNTVLTSYTSTTSNTGKMGILTDLLAWHKADPVDEYEIRRNNLLFKNYTKNRNPFIDFPEWVDFIWGTATYDGRYYQSYNSTPTGYANPSTDVINGYKTDIPVTGISLDKSSLTLNENETYSLTATVTPEDATNKEVTWTSSNTDVATVSDSGLVTAVSAGSATITVTTKDGGYSATCNVTVTYEITSITASVSKTFYVGDTINKSDITVLDNKDNEVTDYTFADDGYQFTYEDASSGGALTNKEFNITYGNLSTTLVTQVQRREFSQSSSNDVLNKSFTGVSGTTYSSWNNKAGDSGAIYAGNNAGGKDSIQLRSSTTSGSSVHSGIVVTSNSTNVKSITVTWHDDSSSTRYLDVYAKNTAYSSQEDLYSETACGTLVGSITKEDTSLTFTDEYKYFGMRSHDGAIYVTSITIEFDNSTVSSSQLADYIMFEDTENQCLSKTDVAIGYFNNLSDQSTFMTSNEYTIKTARNRFEKWLAHQGKEIVSSGDNYVISNTSIYLIDNTGAHENEMLIIISVVSIATLLVTSILIVKKRRKNHN